MNQMDRQIINSAKKGTAPASIAARMGLSRDTVYYRLRKARAAGEDVPHFKGGYRPKPAPPKPEPKPLIHQDHIVVPNRLNTLLNRRAEALGKTPSELARDILEKGLLAGVSRDD